MSEVYSATLEPEVSAALAEDPEGQQLEPGDTAQENKYWKNDSLTPFVGARAGELLKAPWMGGVVASLGEAMSNYSLPMAEADQYSFIAMLEGLLISYKLELEQEQNEEELEADELESGKDEGAEKVLKGKTANKPQNNKTVAEGQKEELEQKAPTSHSQLGINRAISAASKLEKPTGAKNIKSSGSAEKLEPNTIAGVDKTKKNAALNAQKAEVKADQEQFIPGALGKETVAMPTLEAKQKIEAIELEESVTALELNAEQLGEGRIEGTPETIENPELIYSREDFEADVLAQFEFGEIEEIVSGPLEVGGANTFLETIEDNQKPEQNGLANLTLEEVERPLVQLAEAIETSGQEVIEEVNQILDKIIEVPQKTEIDGGVNASGEAEAQKKLEELFIKLFDRMNIEYTDEQIKSLAYLTIHWRLVDELVALKAKEKLADEPQDRGTHEIIKKILVAISTIKKALLRAGSIGKSALRLYNISNARYIASQAF